MADAPMRIVLATHNKDKVKEIRNILGDLDTEIVTLDDFPGAPEPVEDGKTLSENALKKAREISAYTGLTALADDTGLEVDALDGAPGVYAARYAGESATYADNCRKLLDEMRDVPKEKRGAKFRCVIAVALAEPERAVVAATLADNPGAVLGDAAGSDVPDGGPGGAVGDLVADGLLPGRITAETRGEAGFGYDPVFFVPQAGRTLAEMTAEEKNACSHRFRALVEMRELFIRLKLAEEAA